MGHRRFGQVDLETGEVSENGILAYLPPKRRNGFGVRWFAMSQDAGMMIAKSDLKVTDLKVFHALTSLLDFENALLLCQSDLADELGMQRATVNKSIKRLVSFGAVLEGQKSGRIRTYRMNPEFAWRGSARNHVTALDQYRKSKM